MRKGFLYLVALFLIALAVGAYFWFHHQKTQQEKITTVTIGALVPITGGLNVIGQNMQNGMDLAREDLIASGVVKNLTIIYEDACSEASSLVATQKLIHQDKVNMIASSFCIFGQDAVMPITETNKIIIFNTASNPEGLLNYKYGFSTNVAIKYEAAKLAEYAYDKLGARTAAIIHLDSSFGRSYRDNFTRRFEALGGRVLFTQAKYHVSEDFEAPLSKIKKLNPDVLFISHFGTSLGYAVKQAREMGIRSIILGEYESEDTTLVRLARKASEGMIISSPQPSIETPSIRKFEKKYKEKFGEAPDLLARNAYDAVMLEVTAYVSCKGNTDCIAVRLEKTKNYPGASGDITVNPDHSVEKPIIFKKIVNGEYVEIK